VPAADIPHVGKNMTVNNVEIAERCQQSMKKAMMMMVMMMMVEQQASARLQPLGGMKQKKQEQIGVENATNKQQMKNKGPPKARPLVL
jgi:hypothetical protein